MHRIEHDSTSREIVRKIERRPEVGAEEDVAEHIGVDAVRAQACAEHAPGRECGAVHGIRSRIVDPTWEAAM